MQYQIALFHFILAAIFDDAGIYSVSMQKKKYIKNYAIFYDHFLLSARLFKDHDSSPASYALGFKLQVCVATAFHLLFN